ncbi:MAG TPA: phosphopantetheine-binding protein [Polyangiaceae bacterium LLY-WYZ-15_(1-7)]|nr:phosphopantetheine-binding protein [Polyangiaceae bacterium LLY-WYZ-15_(1-7)]HJL05553.1 phosphopantetheine-binding protein [Polyangiaceae bacterium LLY-WYZ-15_(1-7)]HJL10767.1 phosphopantetheine-binding protein [Polyangiaceae bacterium LLY-WYZ-15_(1-7)]HJL27405.1 phosphopantetheine-binding protein [Polyangiaceae bacterium LLY-WYZ-15_(1-7)]HJL32661.1 phosphopantetheine-binding protein [Polyangiaceae bacterium LLY-WYZ-15_(1-7)]
MPTPSEPTHRAEVRREALARALEAFIRERFRVADDDTLFDRETNLWEEGYVDSAGVVEVLAFLEDAVGARLPEDLLFDPEFTSIDGMARLSLASVD